MILLDLYSEAQPFYQKYSSYFGHSFVWNMLHDYGGANGIFGSLWSINSVRDFTWFILFIYTKYYIKGSGKCKKLAKIFYGWNWYYDGGIAIINLNYIE